VTDGALAADAAADGRADIVLMDLTMPGMDGVQATRALRKQAPECSVLILSMHADENYIRNAADAGARGYLLKNAIDIELPDAIRDIAAGKTIGFPKAEPSSDIAFNELTPRERQVLQLIAQGHSNKEIAGLLEVSVNTVSVHRANLMNRLDIHRTAELVLYAIRKGLVSPA
jgi:DNA-binding NarL/FixJ family response regulator